MATSAFHPKTHVGGKPNTRRRRDWTEAILMRSAWLDDGDRALLHAVLDRGESQRSIAAMTTMHPSTIQYRVRRLIARLTDDEVVAVLRYHRDWPHPLDEIALARWVRGYSYRQVGEHVGLSMHEVRLAVERVRGLLEAVRTREKRITWSLDMIHRGTET